jgi:zinc transport system permease protein
LGAAAVIALIWWRWSALLTATLNADLAYASGIDPRREEMFLTIALALVVAVAIKVVGVLLITALLIIPAATARPFVRTPEGMALLGAGIGGLSAIGGLQLAYLFDTPTGPSIVCLAATLFALSTVAARLRAA